MTGALSDLRFDNSLVRALPADPNPLNQRRQVLHACYSHVTPTRVPQARVMCYAREVADLLGLSTNECQTRDFAEVFAGNNVLAGMQPYAACYGGHQFGSWAGQLGDGRAITLGETLNARGERWELQLKGAGPTPYSRTADGRAVLRSSIREFLCSEAMHHLGVPTTRALSVVSTGEDVVRDMFYDGHPKREPGAIVCRVAPSFLRFGNFEILAARGDDALLKALADYAIATHFPELGAPSVGGAAPALRGGASVDTYLRWFDEVCRRTCAMVVHWMRVGFVHGVMNTDNMSLLGLTIDYGPYGWLENYDLDWTPNTTDAGGRRYRYGYQPRIALWNLSRFASSIEPLIGSVEPLERVLTPYIGRLEHDLRAMLHEKLGFGAEADAGALNDAPPRSAGAVSFIDDLPAILQLAETDMTVFFRRLADVDLSARALADADNDALLAPLMAAYYAPGQLIFEQKAAMSGWLRTYGAELQRQGVGNDVRRARMNAVNPKYVLRNYLAQIAIDQAEQGDVSALHELLDVMREPYAEQPSKEEAFAAKRPEWARHRPGCSMLSCSS